MGRPTLLVNAVELLRQPGSHRHLSVQVEAAEVDVADPAVVGPLDVEVDLDTTIDDIIVSGTVAVPWHGACRRCVTPLDEVLRVDVHERYTDGPADDDAFAIEHGQIDLAAMAPVSRRLPRAVSAVRARPRRRAVLVHGDRGRRALGGARPTARLTVRLVAFAARRR